MVFMTRLLVSLLAFHPAATALFYPTKHAVLCQKCGGYFDNSQPDATVVDPVLWTHGGFDRRACESQSQLPEWNRRRRRRRELELRFRQFLMRLLDKHDRRRAFEARQNRYARQREQSKRFRRNIAAVLWVASAVTLEVWQQIPSRMVSLLLTVLSSALQMLSAVTIMASVLVLAVVATTLIVLYPLLQWQGEALRDDIRQSQSPLDPSSRTSQSLRQVLDTFQSTDRTNGQPRWRSDLHAFD